MTAGAGSQHVVRPLRGLCLVVGGSNNHNKGTTSRGAQTGPSGTVRGFPPRPAPSLLSEAIPFFFIARNRHRLWVAREAEGRTGGIFLFKRSALGFAVKNSIPAGCATMILNDRLELDLENRGSRIAAGLDAAVGNIRRMASPLVGVAALRKPTEGEGDDTKGKRRTSPAAATSALFGRPGSPR